MGRFVLAKPYVVHGLTKTTTTATTTAATTATATTAIKNNGFVGDQIIIAKQINEVYLIFKECLGLVVLLRPLVTERKVCDPAEEPTVDVANAPPQIVLGSWTINMSHLI